ncbi:MAG: membrane dipeptidase, partial [Planctomycetes bacterium]|nr:membrane dipeptidase [Planctomycetota bacterium]
MSTRVRRTVSDEEVARVHGDALVVDGQGVAALLPVALIPQPPVDGKSYVQRAREGGMTAMNVTMGIGGIGMGVDNLRAMLNTIHGYLSYFEIAPDDFVHVLLADDVLRAKREGKIGVVFGVQGIGPKIEDDANLILILYRLGLRIGQLTYNERGSIGCGALEAVDTGLTQFGQIVVREMNHAGMLVDLAHAGERTALDAMDLSSQTVV